MSRKSLCLPHQRARLALLLACVAPLSVACAHALDTPSPDALDMQIDASTTAGATGSAGSDASGGSSSAGLGDISGAPSLLQAGADNSNEAGSAGQPAAGAAGRAAGGSNAGGAGGRAAGGTNAGGSSGASSAGAAGSVAAAGAGNHLCKVTADLNAYTPSRAGCGGYAACKGQIHWRNDETHALSQMVLSFQEPSGVTCTSDNATSKWTISDNGATSHRCVFTAIAGSLSVDSQSALSFGYDTTQTEATAPTGLSVSDPSCN